MTTPKKLRLAFMGTPEFAVPALRALIAAHEVICVYSQPPREKGRGHQVQKSPVHETAEEAGIPVRTPTSLKTPEAVAEFASLDLDVAVVAAYGLILPKPVLDAPRNGCINIHASLLPRWRGAAPIHRAILAGDSESGVTIMQMEEGLDTGAMWLMETVPITAETTSQSLHDELSEMGGRIIAEALEGICDGSLIAIQQPANTVTYADKLKKEESEVSWEDDADIIERKVRALNPWPGVTFESRGEKIKILEAEVIEHAGKTAGILLDDQLTVSCGHNALRLLRVQRAGKGPVEGPAFLRGFPAKVGDRV
jgi:methionyl-tRNA formyltransferase